MLKKYPAPALITAVSFIISICSIVNNILYVIYIHYLLKNYNLTPGHNLTNITDVVIIHQLLSPLNLGWIFSSYDGSGVVNYINGAFYILLLLGAIAYVASKKTKSILVRFVFSIIFFSNILSFANSLLYYLFIKSFSSLKLKDILIDVLFYIVHLCWIFISYRILKYFSRNKALEVEVVEEDGKTNSYFVKASYGKRFLHPIIDVFIAIALFSPTLALFTHFNTDNISRLMFQMHETLVERNIWLAIVILRLLYYLFFESILAITPGKLLTETRIIDNNDGNKPSFKNILIRTFSRLVPFEAFSFFADDGWHDKWSQTMVVKEENISMPIQISVIEDIKV